ncbi:MAG: diversity-generating retroelement protein Avd [Bacteriovoracia bacterium]
MSLIHPSQTESNSKDDLPIFVKWMDFLKWLLLTTDAFPKKVRFTFTERINGLALSIVEDLVEARYTRNRSTALRRANLSLEKIRVLIRVCYETRVLSGKSYRHASYAINEVGKMLGGWMKQQDNYETSRRSL